MLLKRAAFIAALFSACTGCASLHGTGTHQSGASPHRKQFLSKTYAITKLYQSMEGPWSAQTLRLMPDSPPELLWITRYDAQLVAEDGKTPMPQELMCHSNFDLLPTVHNAFFGQSKITIGRLFNLSEGQRSINLPDGFGLPVLSNEPLNLTTQVLNHNRANPALHVRYKVTLTFVRDSDLRQPLKPLYSTVATAAVPLNEAQGQTDAALAKEHDPSCFFGANAPANIWFFHDKQGRKFSPHWVVPPGKQITRNDTTDWLRLDFDTTIHYISVHLHPFAESMELIDATEGRSLFKSYAQNAKNRIGIERVDFFSSKEGIPIYKDHRYEVITTYNNSTKTDQDSMAAMHLYLLDKEFDKKKLNPKAFIAPESFFPSELSRDASK